MAPLRASASKGKRKASFGTIDLSQSGAFSIAAGNRAVLNDATLIGRAHEIDAGLTTRTGGRTLRRPFLVAGTLKEDIWAKRLGGLLGG